MGNQQPFGLIRLPKGKRRAGDVAFDSERMEEGGARISVLPAPSSPLNAITSPLTNVLRARAASAWVALEVRQRKAYSSHALNLRRGVMGIMHVTRVP